MKSILHVFIALICFSCSCPSAETKVDMAKLIDESLDYAVDQALVLARSYQNEEGKIPRATDWNGNVIVVDAEDWTSGFYPGELWYLYEYSNNEEMKRMAELYTRRIEGEQYTTNNHDVGFIIYCSVGNEYRIKGSTDDRLKDIIITTAESLCTRYRPGAKVIQSWDPIHFSRMNWECPVIIDNMMNLELLEEASKLSGNPRYAEIAREHANTTIKNHFRDDYSTYHVVDYDPQTGAVRKFNTWQGYSDPSAWARGQAWGLYGYTMMYRKTKDETYLAQANHIADFMLNHKNMPDDKIPFWDFDAPNIPDAYRDVSAGTVLCSGLVELSQYVDEARAAQYMAVVDTQLQALATPFYRAAKGNNGGMLLKHSVGSMPHDSEIDVPIIYADYYYVEALMRYRKLLQTGSIF